MKQIMKKLSSVCAALLCAVTITTAGAVVVSAEEIDASMKEYMVQTAESLAQTIVPLTDEEIAAYMESGDAFTESAMTAWSSSKEELGTLVELGETEVEANDDTYTVTVPAEFEKNKGEFVFTFSEEAVPTAMAVNVNYTLAVNMQRAALNTVMGMGTVFAVLIFLAWLISLMKYIPKLLEGKKKEEPAPAPAPAPVAAAPVVEEVADDTELIAVIAAAIAAAEGTSTDGFVVRSIRKVNRKRW